VRDLIVMEKKIYSPLAYRYLCFCEHFFQWNPFLASLHNGGPVLTIGFNGPINLKVNLTDLPAIDDVDGDGDLDVLNTRFVGAAR